MLPLVLSLSFAAPATPTFTATGTGDETPTGVPIAPKRPSGVWIERTDKGGGTFQMGYHWHRVTERTDGSALSNLTGYEIFVSSSLLVPRAQWTLLTTVPGESWSTTANANAVNYYSLRALDGADRAGAVVLSQQV